MSLNNLFIDEIDPSNVTNSAIRIAEGISKEQRIFQIRSSDWTGFVVAGAMFVFEDDGEFMARNPAFEEDL